MYSSMETIDLCDKVKLEESCVFVDDSALYTISCRVQKLRSYKVLFLCLCVYVYIKFTCVYVFVYIV